MSDPSIAIKHVRQPSYIEQAEAEIVETLKQSVDGSVKVQSFPSDITTFDFAGLKAAALIHYSGSNFMGRKGPANTAQAQRMNFSIVLLIRALKGVGGAYQTLEDIRLALQGESFNGAGPVEIVSDRLVSEVEGQWRFEITIGLDAPAVARERQAPASLMRPATGETVLTTAIPGRPGNP